MLRRLTSLLLALLLAFAPFEGARASQGSLVMPTAGTVSGLTLVNDINAALDALVTCNGGATQPLNSAAAPSTGQWWCDTSVAGQITLRKFDGTSWLPAAVLDTTNHVWTPPIGGGTSTSIAAASTTDLGSVPQAFVSVTSGASTITSFGSSAIVGSLHFVKFNVSVTLTNNATSMILPNNGANIVTAAGDSLVAVYLGGSNWKVLQYQAISGAALNASSNFQGAVFMNAAISPASLSTSQNNWNPASLATANLIRVASSAAVNITGLTAPATPGQRVTIQNVNAAGGFIITLTSNDASSTAANRFLFPHPVGLLPGQALTVVYDATSSGWRHESVIRAQPVAGGFKNLKITNGGTPNNQLTVTADELTVEDVNSGAVRLGAVNCTADVTTNSFSSGLGGLDTGSVAQNQGYYLWVIFNPATNTQSCLLSTASAFGSITLPAGYTYASRVGWDFVENAAGKRFNRILCFGRRCQWVVTASSATANLPIMASPGTAGSVSTPTWVAVPVANFAPATASRLIGVAGSQAGSSITMVAANNSYGASSSTTNPPPVVLNAPTGQVPSTQAFEFALESGNIYWATNGGASFIVALGWEDNL